MSTAHLVRRFFGALSPAGPGLEDEAWVVTVLSEGELVLWRRMSGPDRRHAVGVARRVAAAGFGERSEVLAAALLHDVGKVSSGLSTFERVPATLARSAPRVPDRWRRYYDHPAIGAALLDGAGSHPLAVAWAAEHHSAPSGWTVPADIARVLKTADDD